MYHRRPGEQNLDRGVFTPYSAAGRSWRAPARQLAIRLCDFFHWVRRVAKDTSERGSAWRILSLAMYIPAVLVVAPLVGYFLGHWLDGKLGSGSWFSLLGILLGFGAAARQIYHIVRRIQREQEEQSTDRR